MTVYLVDMEARHSTYMTALLSTILVNEVALYSKTRKTCWTFSGERFVTLHQLLKEQCNEMEDAINEVAGLIRKLNGKISGSIKEFTAMSVLKETTIHTSPRAIIKELMGNHQAVIDELETNILECIQKDQPVIYFIKWLIQQHQNVCWILGTYLNHFPVWLHKRLQKNYQTL